MTDPLPIHYETSVTYPIIAGGGGGSGGIGKTLLSLYYNTPDARGPSICDSCGYEWVDGTGGGIPCGSPNNTLGGCTGSCWFEDEFYPIRESLENLYTKEEIEEFGLNR